MSDVLDEDDTDALAAEFVLGTLDADERTHANLLLDIDDAFRGKVRSWERRLGELHLMVEPVEPGPQIWERIRAKLDGVRPPVEPEPAPAVAAEPEQEPPAAAAIEEAETASTLESTLDELEAELRKVSFGNGEAAEAREAPERPPELFPDRVAEPEIARPFDDADERRPDAIARDRRAKAARERPSAAPYLPADTPQDLRPALRRWRVLAVLLLLLVVAVGGLLTVWRYAPERLPSQLSVYSLLNVPPPSPPAPQKPKAPPESQFDE